jgi:alpha-aminoadipic semialdehyde synthase
MEQQVKKILGIRREDKNEWERRVPLIPDDIALLKSRYGIETIVQPSPIRVFSDDEYEKVGAVVKEDLSDAEVIVAVKEIPTELLKKGKTYLYFSHTIKGQPYNMDMLKRLMGLECNLIDYERIVNEKNLRLIFFGKYAGLAGMIETLYAYGQKMKLKGIATPFEKVKQAYEYGTLERAKEEIKKIGDEIASNGLPEELCPLIVGFAGYGNVSKGAQEIFDLFPHKAIPADQLAEKVKDIASETHNLYKVEFKEEDMVKPKSGTFELQDYYNNPEKYESVFEDYLPNLSMLVNCIYWTEKYPRLVTKDFLKKNPYLGLQVIGDISCDIEGSVEITKDATMPDNPCFTFYPETDSFDNGIQQKGVTVMAVDNLPCEFPKEASGDFSTVLKEYINEMVTADYQDDFDQLKLPYPIKRALILHNGQLTNEYTYMNKFLQEDL